MINHPVHSGLSEEDLSFAQEMRLHGFHATTATVLVVYCEEPWRVLGREVEIVDMMRNMMRWEIIERGTRFRVSPDDYRPVVVPLLCPQCCPKEDDQGDTGSAQGGGDTGEETGTAS